MALEDFTTYTEVDTANDRIQLVGTSHIDFVSSRNAEETYLYKDYGADHFGDFTHKVDASCASGTWVGWVWGLSNTADEILDTSLYIGVYMRYSTAAPYGRRLSYQSRMIVCRQAWKRNTGRCLPNRG